MKVEDRCEERWWWKTISKASFLIVILIMTILEALAVVVTLDLAFSASFPPLRHD
jgi:hypothetical protein